MIYKEVLGRLGCLTTDSPPFLHSIFVIIGNLDIMYLFYVAGKCCQIQRMEKPKTENKLTMAGTTNIIQGWLPSRLYNYFPFLKTTFLSLSLLIKCYE